VVVLALVPLVLREEQARLPAPAAVRPPVQAQPTEADRTSRFEPASPQAAPRTADERLAVEDRPQAPPATLAPPPTRKPVENLEVGIATGAAGARDAEAPRKDDGARLGASEEQGALAKRSSVEAPSGFAAAPPPAAAPPAVATKPRERHAQEAETRVGKLEAELRSEVAGPEARFQALARRKAHSAAEARTLREEWRAFSEKATGLEADEARVRVIEAGVLAYGLSRDAADLARLRSDGAAYLQRPEAAQAARVRALLRSAGAE
jgi:hypothetical protein